MSILFVNGFNDDNTATVIPGAAPGEVRSLCDGNCGLSERMDFGKMKVDSLTLFGDEIKQRIRINPKPSVIFNEISDPDSHRGALRRCEKLCSQLQVPVINHPSNIRKTARDKIPVLLKDIAGLRVPETIRISPRSPGELFTEIDRAGLEFPVIVRLAGKHGGISSILISGRDDIDKLHVYPFDGSTFYLTQYVDYASDDGYYRKDRIVVIDGVPLLRHHLIDKKWMIHVSSRDFMKENSSLMDESTAFHHAFDEQTLPMIRPAIDEITRRLQLQYYGIDCNIDQQGNMLIFEVNANMNILSNRIPLLKEQLEQIRKHTLKLLKKYSARDSRLQAMQHG